MQISGRLKGTSFNCSQLLLSSVDFDPTSFHFLPESAPAMPLLQSVAILPNKPISVSGANVLLAESESEPICPTHSVRFIECLKSCHLSRLISY